MPPKSSRRGRRKQTEDQIVFAGPQQNSLGFRAPNLPVVEGTPTSRRQFSYGAPLEPEPPKSGNRGSASQLSGAVTDFLGKMSEMRASKAKIPTTSKTPSRPQSEVAGEEDELSRSETFLPAPGRQTPAAGRSTRRKLAPASVPQPQLAPQTQQPLQAERVQSKDTRIRQPPLVRPSTSGLFPSDDAASDDARSFGIESDYYGDATIGSTPASVSSLKGFDLSTSHANAQTTQAAPQPRFPDSLPEPIVPNDVHNSQDASRPEEVPQHTDRVQFVPQRLQRPQPSIDPHLQTTQQAGNSDALSRPWDTSNTPAPVRQQTANTFQPLPPGARRADAAKSQSLFRPLYDDTHDRREHDPKPHAYHPPLPQTADSLPPSVDPVPPVINSKAPAAANSKPQNGTAQQVTQTRTAANATTPNQGRTTSSANNQNPDSTSNSSPWLIPPSRFTSRTSLFNSAAILDGVGNPFAPNKDYPSNHSDRDDAMQSQIRATVDGTAHHQSAHDAAGHRTGLLEWLLDLWKAFLSILPLYLFHSDPNSHNGPGGSHSQVTPARVDSNGEGASSGNVASNLRGRSRRRVASNAKRGSNVQAPPTPQATSSREASYNAGHRSTSQPGPSNTSLWSWLHPWAYIRGLIGAIESLMDHFVNLLDYILSTLRKLVASAYRLLPHLFVASLILFVATKTLDGSLTWPSMPNFSSSPHYGVPSLMTKFGSMVHSIQSHIPSIEWSFQTPWLSSGEILYDDGRNVSVKEYLNRYTTELQRLTKASNLHEDSVKKLETLVPKLVHMHLNDGKPVIADDFWHALRDLLYQDDTIFTFDKKGGARDMTWEKHWRYITARLVKDPAFLSTLDLSVREAEDRISSKMHTFWDTWVKNNEDKISQSLGSAVEKINSAGSQREYDERLRKIIKEQLDKKDRETDGLVVTRDEFLRHLKNEFATHRAEIKAEINELKPHLEKLVKQSVDMATNNIPQGLSRAEITTLVDGLVRKTISNMDIVAMAKGQINSHFDKDLKNRINYFGIGAGATIDPSLTSSTYDPLNHGISVDKALKKGWRSSQPLPMIAALTPWESEGDCWCAARSKNKRGNPHGAGLSVQLAFMVIPEYIVVEHILPGATIDPDARPRDIEVYADISDLTVRERVQDFSTAHFPNDESDWDFTPPDYPDRFVKIGQFTYESAENRGGRDVHRLSTELRSLGAATDHVVIRAVNNYGAQNHTCFYRVSLYGYNTEVVNLNGEVMT